MRRRGRECALQILYQLDFGGDDTGAAALPTDIEAAIERYWSSFEAVTDDVRSFAERLARGVADDMKALDEAIAAVSHHWKVGRMGKVDRNLLRLAAYEILRCPDIPRAASINEAVEIAKRFSGNESAAFINGILDQLDASKSANGSTGGGTAHASGGNDG